ncbi:MAG: ACP phosphodiesterase [Xanthomonadales bacterium]|nr:ACP phosphodiesterase [Xanthomonadales bacterium]
MLCYRARMNFLAHCLLARGDDGLVMGALLGDFVRGRDALDALPGPIRSGVRLHRRIDRHTDRSEPVQALRPRFPSPFRRYAGIVIDVGFDHCLAKDWARWAEGSLEAFDAEIRAVLARHQPSVPHDLQRFINYADRRGLFAAYRDPGEILFTLANMGRRFARSNPLHRVGEIWDEVLPPMEAAFEALFPELRTLAEDYRSRST